MSIEAGKYKNITNEEYHAHRGSISRSGLMAFKESPYRYWANYLNPNRPPKEPTPAMIFGSAFHTAILEPHLFHAQYACYPERVLLKDVGREDYDAYKSRCDYLDAQKGLTILSFEDMQRLNDMVFALSMHPQASSLIKDAEYEQSYFWTDPESNLLLKCRPDILHKNMIIDLKTCADASPRAFESAIAKGGYHVQMAMIRNGVREITGKDIENAIFIAVETKYPYSIGIYPIEEEAIEKGRAEYKAICMDLKHAIVHNSFPDYEIQTLSLPRWYV